MGHHVTNKGYRRRNHGGQLEHVEVWERHHGRRKPDGYDVHHVNFDKLDNAPENLLLVDKVTHKRLHSGCELRDGEWWKPCGLCEQLKPVRTEHWYLSREGWPQYGRCRPCHIARVVADKRERKRRARGAAT